MVDPVKNFADADLSLGYDNIVTSVVLSTGHGLKLPDPVANGAYNVVWWNFTDFKDPGKDPNVEIVRITGPAGTGDTKTIVRAQEGTTAKTHNAVGKTYRFGLFMTKKMVDDIISTITTHAIEKLGIHSFDASGLLTAMPYTGLKSFVRASNVAGKGCSISTNTTGSMLLGINCYSDGTNWYRYDTAAAAYRITFGLDTNPAIEGVAAGVNPIGSWSLISTTLESLSHKGVANGYCDLDGSIVVPLTRIPATLTGKDADTVDGSHGAALEKVANKGAVNGYASLDSSALVPLAQLPNTLPSGVILPYGGAAAPSGFLLCDGAAVSRSTYAALFTAIGTTYGVGNGSTTFNVPDFLGRTIIGAGSGGGLTTRVRGDKSGEETHQLSIAELAAHSHKYYDVTYVGAGSDASRASNTGVGTAPNTQTIGSDTPHNNMQPFGVANYIIKT